MTQATKSQPATPAGRLRSALSVVMDDLDASSPKDWVSELVNTHRASANTSRVTIGVGAHPSTAGVADPSPARPAAAIRGAFAATATGDHRTAGSTGAFTVGVVPFIVVFG